MNFKNFCKKLLNSTLLSIAMTGFAYAYTDEYILNHAVNLHGINEAGEVSMTHTGNIAFDLGTRTHNPKPAIANQKGPDSKAKWGRISK